MPTERLGVGDTAPPFSLPSTVGGGGFHADGKLPRFREEDFHQAGHREVFAAVRDLHDKNITPDVIKVICPPFVCLQAVRDAVAGPSPAATAVPTGGAR